MNKCKLQTPTPSKSKRGKYNGHKMSEQVKLSIAKYASEHGDTKACNDVIFAEYKLKPSTVRGWSNVCNKAKVSLGRASTSPEEANLSPNKRDERPQLGKHGEVWLNNSRKLQPNEEDSVYSTPFR